MSKKFTEHFLNFLFENPTSFHVVKNLEEEWKKGKFERLDEKASWNLKPNGRYFVARHGTIAAFIMPQKRLSKALIVASHTDSPSLKLKPSPEVFKENMCLLGVEIYGAPLLSSWLNRDLGLAGRVLYEDKHKQLKEGLVNFSSPLAVIPQLAIHLDRKVNDEGLLLNKQEHLYALAALGVKPGEAFLAPLLSQVLPLKKLLAHDLYLYPVEKPTCLGAHQELINGYRLDSLASVYTAKEALLSASPEKEQLKLVVFTDHEEIGSSSEEGASSPFLAQLIERISLGSGGLREDYLKLLTSSLCVSVDLGHALHPNYGDRHDPQHKAVLAGGILIKTHAQKKYATHAQTAAPIIQTALKANLPYTFISGRNDIPSGSTVGPIHASATGIPTVDVGIAQLSMHSARELMAAKDLEILYKLLQTLLNT